MNLQTLATMNDSSLHLVTQTLLPVLKGMCYEPELLSVSEVPDPQGNFEKLVIIVPSATDAGILNGAGKRQSTAIRNVFDAAFRRSGIKAEARIHDGGGTKRRLGNFSPNPNFERDTGFNRLLASVLNITFEQPPRIIRNSEELDHATGFPCQVIVIEGEPVIISAIADMFYPFGIRQGKKLKIRPTQLRNDNVNNPLRTSPLSR